MSDVPRETEQAAAPAAAATEEPKIRYAIMLTESVAGELKIQWQGADLTAATGLLHRALAFLDHAGLKPAPAPEIKPVWPPVG